jgi:hypothetical protein
MWAGPWTDARLTASGDGGYCVVDADTSVVHDGAPSRHPRASHRLFHTPIAVAAIHPQFISDRRHAA